MNSQTKPCEYCGTSVTKTARQALQRQYWTCGRACSGKLRITRGRTASGWQENRFRGIRETRSCAVCGRPITRYVTEQNHGQAWKCSRVCMLEVLATSPRKRRGQMVSCAACGTEFYSSPGDVLRNRRYCSAECAHVGLIKPITLKTCDYCGAEMRLQPSVAKIRRFCSRGCTREGKITRSAGRMHNGRPARLMEDGYVKIWEPTHPNANRGWVLEHRWLMEQQLGRILPSREEVDHINQNRSDNRIENLQVLTRSAHRSKTADDRRSAKLTMEQRLAEYERRFGPLD